MKKRDYWTAIARRNGNLDKLIPPPAPRKPNREWVYETGEEMLVRLRREVEETIRFEGHDLRDVMAAFDPYKHQ